MPNQGHPSCHRTTSEGHPTPPLREILEFNAPIPTWFKCGGPADCLARPRSMDELRDLLQAFACKPVRILGDGANLLVADEGVDGVVISLERLNAVNFEEGEASSHQAIKPSSEEKRVAGVRGIEGSGEAPHAASRTPHPAGRTPHSALVRADAGAKLPQLITECVRRGLAGLETLAGIPATVGGAVVMNAGGSFGQLCDTLVSIEALTRFGQPLTIPRREINFSYRHSGLEHLIIAAATFALRRVDEAEQPALREKLKEVMAYKKGTQPMAANSAGCCFKNPVVAHDVPSLVAKLTAPGSEVARRSEPGSGSRISAGKLIDQSGCKGLRIGAAEVSSHHANFIVAHEGCTATDIIRVMEEVERRVLEKSGVRLEREVVVWRRGEN